MSGIHYKVLVPLDFTESSRFAVEYVLQAFASRLTHLYLLHAYKEATASKAPMVSLIDILRQKSERLMHIELQRTHSLKQNNDIEIVAISLFEELVPAILEITREANIDMVALGTNGVAHPRLDVKDDDPFHLLHKINLPLLLVPKIAN